MRFSDRSSTDLTLICVMQVSDGDALIGIFTNKQVIQCGNEKYNTGTNRAVVRCGASGANAATKALSPLMGISIDLEPGRNNLTGTRRRGGNPKATRQFE